MSRRVYFREIYFYIVCLVAIIIFVIGLVMAYDGSINFAKPTTYMTRANLVNMYTQEQYVNFSEEQITDLVDDEINAMLQNEKNIAFKSLLRGVLLVVIAVPLFLFHWRKAQQMWKTSLEDKESD